MAARASRPLITRTPSSILVESAVDRMTRLFAKQNGVAVRILFSGQRAMRTRDRGLEEPPVDRGQAVNPRRAGYDDGNREVVQYPEGLRLHRADGGGNDAFVHISAVERAGLADLHEGQKVGFDLVADSRNGKMSADNLKTLP